MGTGVGLGWFVGCIHGFCGVFETLVGLGSAKAEKLVGFSSGVSSMRAPREGEEESKRKRSVSLRVYGALHTVQWFLGFVCLVYFCLWIDPR